MTSRWLLVGIISQAVILDAILHNAVYGLFILLAGWGFWGNFVVDDEPVFFLMTFIALFGGLIAGLAVKPAWGAFVEERAKKLELPSGKKYIAPFINYAWLWKFSRGRGYFLLGVFLGFVGIIIDHMIRKINSEVKV